MKDDITALKASDQKLRADLMATQTALVALMRVLQPQQQQQWLDALTADAVSREEIYDALPIGVAENQEAVTQTRRAAERVMRRLLDASSGSPPR